MRTDIFNEVSVSPVSFLNRSALVAAVLFAGATFAQPVNDTCANAENLTITPSLSTTSSLATNLNLAATAAEAPMSCNSSGPKNTVWYSFTAPITGRYRIDNCSSANYDSVLAVYTGGCAAPTQITSACNDQGPTGCSPASLLELDLTAGTQYLVQVGVWSSVTIDATAVTRLTITSFLPHPLDTCGPTSPMLPLNRVVAATTAAVDAGFTSAADNSRLDGGVAACFAGIGQTTSTASGRDVAYMFRAPAAGNYSIRAHYNSTPNTVLYLTNSCLPSPGLYGQAECVAASNRNSSAAEQITCLPMTSNQEVYVWLDESSASTAGAAVPLEVSACFQEVEPNDTPATASPLLCTVTGGIRDAGEPDFFALGAPPAGSRVYALVEAAAANVTNFDLRVTTETTTLEYDDSNASSFFGDSSGLVAGTPLTGAPAYLRVSYGSATTLAEPYLLYSKVQTGTPTPEIEPNNTIATATGGSMYFEGSITDGGSDVDFFSFAANEGDVIFAALDSVPDRRDAGTTATFNLALSLVDSSGAILQTSDDSSTTVTLTTNPDAGLTATVPSVPGDALVYRARSTGTYGIRIGKTSGLTPTAYGLSISVGCGDVAPTFTGFTPTAGSPAGGETITLTGTNFSEKSVVRFGNNVAPVVSISATELIVRAPASALGGEVSISVTNGIGLSATAPGQYTYEDPPGIPPTVTAISPTSGPTAGGRVVTVTGTVFRADAGVFFDLGGTVVPAASVTVNSSTRLTVTTPPHAEGVASVQVVNFDTLSATLPNAYTYLGPPTITGITPATGLTTGGQTVTITGTNLRAGTTVRIGGTLATSPTPAADGLSMTAVTPSNSANVLADVRVVTPDNQEATLTGGYQYVYPAPTVATVSPTSGFASGNTLITLTGANFLSTVTVTVGGVAATNVTRTSATNVTARTPAGTPGTAPVVLTNSDGQVSSPVNFTYVAAPVLTSIAPSNGPMQGGTRITLTGTDFVPGARVTIGGVPAFAVAVASSTSLTATTNSGAPGAQDVVVTNPDTQSSTLDDAFTLNGAPSLTSISPISGATTGGTVVTLTGSGFRQGAEVLFGATAAASVTMVSDTELTATTAPRAIGVVAVTVRNADGQSAELARAFRFAEPPSVSGLNPSSGDVAGGNVVRLTGAGFTQASTVTFGGVASPLVTLVSPTELDARVPPHAPGVADVVVSVDGAAVTVTGGYTYVRGAPSISTVAPSTGGAEGGTLVTITGSGFADGATVTFGGTAATSVVVASADLIRAVAPAHAAGVVDIVVTNDDSQAGALSGGFTYTAASGGPDNSITDGGSGAVGTDPSPTPTPGGVSCGCTSFDGSMFGFAGLGLVALLSRRRRRS